MVADEIRGLILITFLTILSHTPNKASKEIAKVLNRQLQMLYTNNQLDEEKLYVAECYIDEGVTMKRFRPRAKGAAAPIMKRTSHITVVVAERAGEDR